ncbi:MAG TPA: aldehyde dehydrogenase family protein [Roseiflexaceae bacterium]|nr:aldehyde dehydrogenase family protein [Roseiflexaceae bacterium]HMP42077.1 aldehyde dehydrogenase family protein [Roseiflexaceae bacterium]
MIEHEQALPSYQLYIDGQWVDATSNAWFTITEAARNSPLAMVARAGRADVDRAVAAARAAFDTGPWPHMPGHERSRILSAIADLIEARTAEFAEAESRNLGAPLRKTSFIDIPFAIEHLRTFAEFARTHPYEALPWTDLPSVSWNFVWREPIGVCAQIIPWNYPLLMAVWKIAPALATGNTIILKPSSYTPLTALMLMHAIHDAQLLPRGVLNLLSGPGSDIGVALAQHPAVDKVAFTGSTAVGRDIMRHASATIKHVTLELGGKSPSLIMPDADLDLAVDGVLFGVFFNGGQSCEAGTRCFVPQSLHDTFVEKLIARTRMLTLGDPLDFATDLGPLVSPVQGRIVEEYIALGLAEGATLATGGRRLDLPGHTGASFIEPTILTNVHNSMRIAQEEIFGPVLAVIPYTTVTEAIELANTTIYGLGAAIWSRDIQGAIEVARRIRAGTIWINDHHLIHPHAPFGGYKQSGIGREHGLQGMLAYTEAKHIHVDLHQRRSGRLWWDVLLPEA